ncbi:beta-propeller domain-containing protein [Marinimicrobium agarilyticum]|uniref:beta-propeller domain-containing protein n=1 Tax=Marinimicrobium agarilyticum TaxID=306546 RepID=UPI000487D58F|nr:beta-propeller domain-containing protein [Marinimicrobium agarilyticum]
MLSRFPLALSLTCLSILLLSACGGSSGGSEPRGREDIDYSNLRWDDPALEPLTNEHEAAMVAEYLRNGVRLRVGAGYGFEPEGENTADNSGSPMPGGADDDGYSQTNVHVKGVDEADRLKYDGRHLFVAESPQYSLDHFLDQSDVNLGVADSVAPPEPQQTLSIYRTQPQQANAQPLAQYDFMRDQDSPLVLSQLYLEKDENGVAESVLALSDSRMAYGGWGWGTMPELALYQGRARVEWVDVTSPANPVLSGSLDIEGTLLNSRKVGSVLYLVSRTSPAVAELEYSASDGDTQARNERLIQSAPLESLLPGYRVDGGERRPLVTEGECYLPQALEPDEGYSDIVTVSAFDANTRERLGAVCVNARLTGVYMSLENVYLAAEGGSWNERKTALHKFAANDGAIEYRGTGLVPGGLGNTDPAFRMDEKDGFLRVVTTAWEQTGDLVHSLHVLHENEEAAGELAVVARLPNESRPAPIGKPGENIYAVRFLGERAYVVTFEQVDPLYVIDVGDPLAPKVLGELEIPGVSDYLHPIDGDYLVSVGRSATEDGWMTGLKVELFDVRDDQNPLSVAAIEIGGRHSWSEALHDLRAFNFIRTSDDELRFTIPASRYDEWEWQDSGLHLFSVNGISTAQAQLEAAGALVAESADRDGYEYPRLSGSDRSRIHGEAVYYLHGDQVWARFWGDAQSANGPFTF